MPKYSVSWRLSPSAVSYQQKFDRETGEMAQWGKYLLGKHGVEAGGGLRLTLRNPCKSPTEQCACNPSVPIARWEVDRPGRPVHAVVNSRDSLKTRWNVRKPSARPMTCGQPRPTVTRICTHIYIHIHHTRLECQGSQE